MCSPENGKNEKHQPLLDCLAKNHNGEMATFFGETSLPLTLRPSIGGAPHFHSSSPSMDQQGEFSTLMGARNRVAWRKTNNYN